MKHDPTKLSIPVWGGSIEIEITEGGMVEISGAAKQIRVNIPMSTRYGEFLFTAAECDKPDEKIVVDISTYQVETLDILAFREATKKEMKWENAGIRIESVKSDNNPRLVFTASEAVDDPHAGRNKLILNTEKLTVPAAH